MSALTRFITHNPKLFLELISLVPMDKKTRAVNARRSQRHALLVSVKFKNNQPFSITDLVSGWIDSHGQFWGRPVDVQN